MVVTQQPTYAPGCGEQRQVLPGNGQGQGQTWQPPAAAPPPPISAQERAQQLTDFGALMSRFPYWFFWFRGRRWTATLNVGEHAGLRVEGDSPHEIAARIVESAKPSPAPPTPPVVAAPSVPRPVSRPLPPQTAPPQPQRWRQPQGWPRYRLPPQRQPQPVGVAGGWS